jgi:hypothetical protein
MREMKKIATPFVLAIVSLPFVQTGVNAAPPTAAVGVLQMRTYVSGGGKDSNPCTAASPCLGLTAALARTLAGGEIFVLDSANYGPVTINKSVSITSEGASAGVLASSGTAITINAGANDVVNLKGFNLDGGNTAATGIQFVSGAALNIQKSSIRGFSTAGISFAPTATGALFVSDTIVSGNAMNGISITGSGSNVVNAMISRVSASRNGVGVLIAGANAKVTLTDTVAGNNSYGVGASAATVMVRNSTFSNNSVGIAADQAAKVQVGQSTVTANGTGWTATNGGQVISYGNNNVRSNGIDGVATVTVALQ